MDDNNLQMEQRCLERLKIMGIKIIYKRGEHLKMIPELRYHSYEERFKECGLTTPETRRLRGDHIEDLKILNRYEKIYRNIYLT